MAKTKDVYRVQVFFSKEEFKEWKDLEDVEWEDDNTVQFTDRDGGVITVNAPAQVIVVTKKQEVVSQY